MQLDLSSFGIGDIPFQYYIPNFITAEQEELLIKNIERAPKSKWTNLSNRQLQNWGGLPKGPNDTMLEEPLPEWLQVWCNTLKETLYTESESELELIPFFSKAPNHVLINKYLPGQGIMVRIFNFYFPKNLILIVIGT